MADCSQILTGCFPSIDSEIVEYVNGMLEDPDVVSSTDEVFESIGPFLEQVDESKTEDDIRDICTKLYHLVSKTSETVQPSKDSHRVLDAPVQISSLLEDRTDNQSKDSIWMAKRDDSLQVDSKQLAKAEALIQKKQKKQADKDKAPKQNGVLELPSASQQFNRKDMKLDASGTNRNYDIKIDNFDIAFGEKVLLTGASIHMSAGRRYGLCGRNGLGKTTLLKMISSGSLKIPSHISILHVEQEVVGDETFCVDSVLESDVERTSLLKREKELTQLLNLSPNSKGESSVSGELSEIYHRLEMIEADKAPSRAAVILAGLGFSPDMQKLQTKALSGGWRMRLALARALFSKPDLLLLDEPTNMLDMKAIIWLEDYLQTWPTTILVVSHDRSFLNEVCTDIVHLWNKQLDVYKGNYDQFDKTRTERIKNQQKEYEAQKQYREHIQVFIDRFRYNANRASQVQSKLKMLEKLPVLVPPAKDTDVVLKFPECEKLQSNILQLDEVQFYYKKDSVIFEGVDCNANMSSRICIVGENGAGKTTLLKILLGDLSPTKGVCHVHRHLRIGYFSQHHVDQLSMDLTSVELLAQRFPGKPTEQYRNALGQYGVSGELGMRPVTSLSGGQKRKPTEQYRNALGQYGVSGELGMRPVTSLSGGQKRKPTEQYRNALGQYGVSGELGMRPVTSLSGGQKSRVAFLYFDQSEISASGNGLRGKPTEQYRNALGQYGVSGELGMRPVTSLSGGQKRKPTEQYRNALGQYGVSGELGMRPVTSLSGGQKSRVAFAVMSMTNPNFFILDEPTNHLDMETIEALGNALKKFAGGCILVSHDERLIKMVCEELWVVKNKTVQSLEGGFEEYKKIVEKELKDQGV